MQETLQRLVAVQLQEMQAVHQAQSVRIAQSEELLARGQAAHQNTRQQLSSASAEEQHPATHDLLEGVRHAYPRHYTEPYSVLLQDLVAPSPCVVLSVLLGYLKRLVN